MTTPAETMRAAARSLRCDHRHPVNPPGGSFFRPGPCEKCGTPWDEREAVPDWLTEQLADLLEEIARQYDAEPCDSPDGVCNGCESRPDFIFAKTVAETILGEVPGD